LGGRYLAPGSRGAADVAQLASALEKATGGAPGESMLQRELELRDATSGPDGVDRDPDLHAPAVGEGEQRGDGLCRINAGYCPRRA
jgi:hypothetical protein